MLWSALNALIDWTEDKYIIKSVLIRSIKLIEWCIPTINKTNMLRIATSIWAGNGRPECLRRLGPPPS
jgi:hypothetical protein